MWENANVMAKNLETTHFPIVCLRVKMMLHLVKFGLFASLFFFKCVLALVTSSGARLTMSW